MWDFKQIDSNDDKTIISDKNLPMMIRFFYSSKHADIHVYYKNFSNTNIQIWIFKFNWIAVYLEPKWWANF